MLRERIERPSLLLHNSAFTTKLSELNLNKPSLFVRTVGPSKTELVLIDDKDFDGQPSVAGLYFFMETYFFEFPLAYACLQHASLS